MPGWLAHSFAKVKQQQASRRRPLLLMTSGFSSLPARRRGGAGAGADADADAPAREDGRLVKTRVLIVAHAREAARASATAPLLRHPSLASRLVVEQAESRRPGLGRRVSPLLG